MSNTGWYICNKIYKKTIVQKGPSKKFVIAVLMFLIAIIGLALYTRILETGVEIHWLKCWFWLIWSLIVAIATALFVFWIWTGDSLRPQSKEEYHKTMVDIQNMILSFKIGMSESSETGIKKLCEEIATELAELKEKKQKASSDFFRSFSLLLLTPCAFFLGITWESFFDMMGVPVGPDEMKSMFIFVGMCIAILLIFYPLVLLLIKAVRSIWARVYRVTVKEEMLGNARDYIQDMLYRGFPNIPETIDASPFPEPVLIYNKLEREEMKCLSFHKKRIKPDSKKK